MTQLKRSFIEVNAWNSIKRQLRSWKWQRRTQENRFFPFFFFYSFLDEEKGESNAPTEEQTDSVESKEKVEVEDPKEVPKEVPQEEPKEEPKEVPKDTKKGNKLNLFICYWRIRC